MLMLIPTPGTLQGSPDGRPVVVVQHWLHRVLIATHCITGVHLPDWPNPAATTEYCAATHADDN